MKELGIVIVVIVGLAAIFGLGPWCLHYTVNFWLAYAHKPQTFGWFPSLLGIPFCELSVPAAAITFVLGFFI